MSTSSLVPGRFLCKAGLFSVEVGVVGEEIEVTEEEVALLFGSLEGITFDIFIKTAINFWSGKILLYL